MAIDILIIDDENDIRDLVAGILSDEGYSTRTAAHADAALNEIAARRPNLIFLDIWLQGSRIDGLALLDEIRNEHGDLPVVMISGHGNIETAVSAIKRGAYDYIEKPFKSDRLVHVAERALEAFNLRREIKELREKTADSSQLLGDSPPMSTLRVMIDKVAPTNSRVMISGMSGVGKELVARAIHDASSRGGSPFIAINAATITPDHMEHELFGTEPSNGRTRKIGALEEAHGGTLYLDEIAEMPRGTQNKILRVLVDQSFQRVGGTSRITVDVRVISSTAQDLSARIESGDFREDLFHRLAVVPMRVPALSERREDIPLLVRHFVDQISRASGLPRREIGDDAMAILQAHDWPGNIRQLRNNVERLLILARGGEEDVIHSDMLPAEIGEMLPTTPGQGAEHLISLPLRDAREIFERDYLAAQVTRFGGNISRTAEFVGMERSALHRKLKSLGVN